MVQKISNVGHCESKAARYFSTHVKWGVIFIGNFSAKSRGRSVYHSEFSKFSTKSSQCLRCSLLCILYYLLFSVHLILWSSLLVFYLPVKNTVSAIQCHSPSPPATPLNFSVFTPASEPEVYKILSSCPNKQCDSDPIPTWLVKECSSVLVPTITNIVNLSLISGQFHPTLKESVISPLLKKSTLDKEELSNYRPISNLSLISKIIERVVKSRLM